MSTHFNDRMEAKPPLSSDSYGCIDVFGNGVQRYCDLLREWDHS